jgi:hypothetical protein
MLCFWWWWWGVVVGGEWCAKGGKEAKKGGKELKKVVFAAFSDGTLARKTRRRTSQNKTTFFLRGMRFIL